MITQFRIDRSVLSALGRGAGDRDGIRMLARAHLSRNLIYLGAVLDQLPPRHPGRARVEEGFGLLCTAQATRPAALAAVIAQPHVGVWARRCLAAVREGTATWPMLGYLNACAASAAHHSGIDGVIDVPVVDGRLVVPGVGSALLPTTDDRVRLSIAGGRLMIEGHRKPRWRALRRLVTATDACRIDLLLDDLDPYRDYPGLTLAAPVTRAQHARWDRAFTKAWEAMCTSARPYAQAVAAGAVCVVPLAETRDGFRGATHPNAFGAVALSYTGDASELAAGLLHEFQHSKLACLLDLISLHSAGTRASFYAPWRDDPRPLEALLQGAYAFLGVTDFWRVHRNIVHPAEAERAHFEFAYGRLRVAAALDSLYNSGLLTHAGEQFVAAMMSTSASWQCEPVPDKPKQQARDVAQAHHARWRRRHARRLASRRLCGIDTVANRCGPDDRKPPRTPQAGFDRRSTPPIDRK